VNYDLLPCSADLPILIKLVLMLYVSYDNAADDSMTLGYLYDIFGFRFNYSLVLLASSL
jgi:hypothetical protein